MQILRYANSMLLLMLILSTAHSPASAGDLPDEPQSRAQVINMDSPDRVPGRWIVIFKDDDALARDVPRYSTTGQIALPGVLPNEPATRDSLSKAMAEAVSGKLVRVLPGVRDTSLRGFVVEGMADDQVEKLTGDPRIKYIEAVLTMTITFSQSLPPDNSLWHLDRLDQPFLPLNRTYNYFTGGVGVRIAVFDTGILETHEEFEGRITTNVWDCTTIGSSEAGCDTYGEFVPIPTYWDCNGHGTHVASLAGGTTYGVAKAVEFRIFKVVAYCNGAGLTDHFIYALNELLTHPLLSRTVAVTAFQALAPQPTIEGLIESAMDEGVTFVVSAGKTNANACNYSPARMSQTSSVITVGASTSSDARFADSNFGSCVTLFAPGKNVTGADKGSDTDHQVLSGSSQAAPIVAGIAALYKNGAFLDATPANVKSTLVSEAVNNRLTGIGTGSPNKLANSGVPGNNFHFSTPVGPILIYQTIVR